MWSNISVKHIRGHARQILLVFASQDFSVTNKWLAGIRALKRCRHFGVQLHVLTRVVMERHRIKNYGHGRLRHTDPRNNVHNALLGLKVSCMRGGEVFYGRAFTDLQSTGKAARHWTSFGLERHRCLRDFVCELYFGRQFHFVTAVYHWRRACARDDVDLHFLHDRCGGGARVRWSDVGQVAFCNWSFIVLIKAWNNGLLK